MFESTNRVPVKLLLAIPAMVLGGTQRVYLTLMKQLNRTRVEPHLAVIEKTGGFLASVPRDVPVHDLGVKHARNAVWPLVKLCWKIKPDVVLSASAHLNAAVVMASKFMPAHTVVMTREGADITAPEQHVSRHRLQIYAHLYRRADVVICQSQYMKEKFVNDFGIPPTKLACIYNPVDLEYIREAAAGPDPFPTAGPNFVYAGRLSCEKGVDLLLQSMLCVRRALPDAKLTVLGEGPDAGRLFHLRHNLELEPSVRFIGETRNPYPFLAHAACVVLPSQTEAFPNVVLESIALGTKVVATDCSGALPEITAITGLLKVCHQRTPECLAKTMIESLLKPGTEARSVEPLFMARFGIHATVALYERLVLLSAEQKKLSARHRVSVDPDYTLRAHA